MKYKAFSLLDNGYLEVLDQTVLPFSKKYTILKSSDDVIVAIKTMIVRGAGVIGNIAAFGVYLASLESNGNKNHILEKSNEIGNTRPTAVTLRWAVDRMLKVLDENNNFNLTHKLKEEAIKISEEDRINSEKIGKYGFELIKKISESKKGKKVNILTHCNAGWLAIIDSGTALAPIYEAKKNGMDIHVWVDETRPRNQGTNLTSWELTQSEIDHTLIVDNSAGLLMQKGFVDIAFVGADRVTGNGDVINKIGTYQKALSAKDNNVPFYAAFPKSTFDNTGTKASEIEIECREDSEIKYISGLNDKKEYTRVLISLPEVKIKNFAFDITPARLITGLITEDGIQIPGSQKKEAL